jgi:pyruvate kinase
MSILEGMVRAGMTVARINCSHGDFTQHRTNIRNVRKAAETVGRPISFIMDLPGIKIRLGKLKNEPLVLKKGSTVVLTAKKGFDSDPRYIPVEFKHLAKSVKKGGTIYLNDGFIQLKVLSIRGEDVACRVIMAGNLFSHKGLNLPGAKLVVNPITKRDLEFVRFGLEEGVNTFGLSFVETAKDIIRVRNFAKSLGKTVNLVAKIERREAIENFDEIVKVSDGVMIARGDLGVEIPVEEVPIIQKTLISKANLMGRPVITATQMLESMTENVRPTRAEVNDVANAILDGSDAVMLSGETAIGAFPVETVRMMAQIAAVTERKRESGWLSSDESEKVRNMFKKAGLTKTDVITLNVVRAAEDMKAKYILTPIASGNTARRISRFKPSCWVLAYSRTAECGFLSFSYGIYPLTLDKNTKPEFLANYLIKALREESLAVNGDIVVITERRLSDRRGETDSLSIITLD